MVDAVTEALARALEAGAWTAPLLALAGGLATAANPCVLGMVPVLVAYVAGRPGQRAARRSLLLSLAFAAGLTATFTAMFLATWAVHGLIRDVAWNYLAAAVCLLMGLHMLGLVHLELPAPSWAPHDPSGVLGALALGLLFGLTSLPCAGPVLLVLLAVLPTLGLGFGALLLAAYGLGHCALIVAAGTSVGWFGQALAGGGARRAASGMQAAAGVLALAAGAYLLFLA